MVFESILLGAVEGATEFLPISSTAHLLLVSWALNQNDAPDYALEIMIQAGAILALLAAYRERLIRMIQTAYAASFLLKIGLAFLPIAVLGVILYPVIIHYFFTLNFICAALILGGVAMLIVERWPRSSPIDSLETIPWTVALKIGLIQCFALIPGASRAAMTIIGGLICGLNRQTAVEFSFFLAVPSVLGAALYHGYELETSILWNPSLLLGTGVAFLTALIAIRFLLFIIHRSGMVAFAWYRILLGFGLLIFASDL